jgi:C4-dicarboxylate-specific signal transduction histidine kinase
MNIYSKKRSWKVFLLSLASIIVVISLWYTNGFISKLAKNEKVQVELWANAISRKANLVKYTEGLFDNLRMKEKSYVYLWSEATKKLIYAGKDDDIDFFTGVISGNKDIPVIVTDENGNITASNNLDPKYQKLKTLTAADQEQFTNYPPIIVPYFEDQLNYIYYRNSNTYYQLKRTLEDLTKSFLDEIVNNNLSSPVIVTDSSRKHVIAYSGYIDSTIVNDKVLLQKTLHKMEESKQPIIVNLPNKGTNFIFYDDSPTLIRMRYFPVVFMSVIGLFLIISYVLFSYSRKSEQSKVWAGMAKETAHQLGTPISSLMGWIEVMKMNYPDEQAFVEMDKDIDRLKLVSERFSKIGSVPELKEDNVIQTISGVVDYMQRRAPKKIDVIFLNDRSETIITKLNPQLIIWVFENLIKNAVDAIGSNSGKIEIFAESNDYNIIIDVIDTGKGIPKSMQKAIFNPGYSTKTRGWGLGLSLSKRIIEEYHKGKIFVKNSIPGQGSTFRIVLKKV